jgi:hypothetical protein
VIRNANLYLKNVAYSESDVIPVGVDESGHTTPPYIPINVGQVGDSDILTIEIGNKGNKSIRIKSVELIEFDE